MIRTLLATTALAAVLALPVIAQETSSSMETPMASSSMEAPMASSSMEAPMTSSSMEAPATSSEIAPPATSSEMAPAAGFDISTGYTRVDTDRLATHIIGQPVYDGPAKDANNLGNINDLVLDMNGDVQAVVVGVGGFLGIGEKQVAVPFSALQHVVAEDQTERFVIATTSEQLTAAPDFVTTDDRPVDGATPMTPAPADLPPSSAPAM